MTYIIISYQLPLLGYYYYIPLFRIQLPLLDYYYESLTL